MPQQTFVTTLPNKSGAFLIASRIIARQGGNITRVSYNKAVDLHTLFLEVSASEAALKTIAGELDAVGYLAGPIPEMRVVMVNIRIPDTPGSLLPVLKILDRYDINISYMNASAGKEAYQDFVMGLLLEKPAVIRLLLEEISELYPIDVIDYEDGGTSLDNTVFYIRLASEMRALLGLSDEQTMAFLSESNRILQVLQEKGEGFEKPFDYIRRFARFVSSHRGNAFHADIETVPLSSETTLYAIQPPCGSNTYVIDSRGTLTLIDSGYAVYHHEMEALFCSLFPDWHRRPKQLCITHADVDHCGLLAWIPDAPILLNQKSAESLRHQSQGIPDNRESTSLHLGYSKLSQIISGYRPPDASRFVVLDRDTPKQHEGLLPIFRLQAGELELEVYEGSGGHLPGEMVLLCRQYPIVFTGDILVNISGFSPERAAFNSLAPYLMTSVNVDSGRARSMRGETTALIEALQAQCGRAALVCGGHGPLSLLQNGAFQPYHSDTRS